MQTLIEAKKKKSKKSTKPGSGGSREAPHASEAEVADAAPEIRRGITIDPETGEKTGPISRAREKIRQKRRRHPGGVPSKRRGDVTKDMP